MYVNDAIVCVQEMLIVGTIYLSLSSRSMRTCARSESVATQKLTKRVRNASPLSVPLPTNVFYLFVFSLFYCQIIIIIIFNKPWSDIFLPQENLVERETEVPDEASIAESLPEQDILIQSVCETMVPKLVAEDIPLLFSLLNDVFPNVGYTRAEMSGKFQSTFYH